MRKTSNTESGYESTYESNQSRASQGNNGGMGINGTSPAEKTTGDYIKNVFIKYLEYQATANEKEAQTLEKVLFTVLKVTEKDIELLEKARSKNHSGGILSYFYYSSQPQNLVARPVQPRVVEGLPIAGGSALPDNTSPSKQRRSSYHGHNDQNTWTKQGSNEKIPRNVTINENPGFPQVDNRKLFNINIS